MQLSSNTTTDNKYQLLFPNNNNHKDDDESIIFYTSITNNLNIASLHYHSENITISFYSTKYPLFFHQLSYIPNVLIMESIIKNIIQQIHFLETHNLSIVSFDIEDLLFIHPKNCVFINPDSIIPITNKKQIVIDFPVITNMFSSPELLSILEIPSSISYKNIYYSIGAFVLFVFLRKNIQLILLKEDDEETQKKKLEKELIPIFHTKIYWFLRRCLKKDPSKRLLLL